MAGNPKQAVDKKEAKRIMSEIRQVLLDFWDPIHVGNESSAQDEYDCCIGGVFHLLRSRHTDDEIADYLLHQENEHMGLGTGVRTRNEVMNSTIAALRRIGIPEAVTSK